MPLRWKLVALYAVILAAVIGGIALALPIALRRHLLQATDAELETRARALGALVEVEDGKWVLEQQAALDADYAAAGALYYVVLDDTGAPVLASALASALELGVSAEPGARDRASGDERRFRELAIALTKADEDDPLAAGTAFSVVCGKDLREVDFSVHALVRLLWIIGPTVLLLSLMGGLLLSRRALRPIDKIARTAEEISAGDLSRRIDVRGRDEVARLGRTLNDTFARLQQAFERLQRFTADASHELRTPLSVIAGNAELALRRPRTVAEYQDLMGEIRTATAQMQSVVEHLLALARADAGEVALEREPVQLQALCDDVIRLHRPLAARAEVEIAFENGTAGVEVRGDRERLQVLVSNLIANAIRYNRPGGNVRVRVGRDGDQVSIEIADTGIGIPAADLPRVFERFYRVDAARSRAAGGSGLGLAIARWIAQAHGGAIRVVSEPGRGSVFTVVLPAVAG